MLRTGRPITVDSPILNHISDIALTEVKQENSVLLRRCTYLDSRTQLCTACGLYGEHVVCNFRRNKTHTSGEHKFEIHSNFVEGLSFLRSYGLYNDRLLKEQCYILLGGHSLTEYSEHESTTILRTVYSIQLVTGSWLSRRNESSSTLL